MKVRCLEGYGYSAFISVSNAKKMESSCVAHLPVVGQAGNDESLELGNGCHFGYYLADQGLFSLMPQPMAKRDESKFTSKLMFMKGCFSFRSDNKNPIMPSDILLV